VDAQLSVVAVFVVDRYGWGDTLFEFVRRKHCIWRLHAVFFCRFRGRLNWQVVEAVEKVSFEGAFDVSISRLDFGCRGSVGCVWTGSGAWAIQG
jgi:hypothetical protein